MSAVNGHITSASQQMTLLEERTNTALLKIIRDNITSQYASQAPLLAKFRDAVSAHGGIEDDATLLADFRTHVPFSSYDPYKPFIDRFNVQPCRLEDVENLLSPGLPDFFALSSATSGTRPKVFPKYDHDARLNISPRPVFDPNNEDPFAALVCTGYRDVKAIEREAGEVVQKIPVCVATGGYIRRSFGWYSDDESWMSLKVPGFAVPLAATTIGHFKSFMIIHGLFFLSDRNIYRLYTVFATHFIDLIRHIRENWDMLLSCIREGTIPDLEGMDDVRKYLQAHFRPNPGRAAELLEIGPPLSEGWFPRVWPKVDYLWTICSGPFSTVLPKVKFILGPDFPIRSLGYGSSESLIGLPYDDGNVQDEFVLQSDDIVEFLDVSLDATPENLGQAWEVEVSKNYEPIITTRDGLWRYRLGDVIQIVGFHPESNSPVFKYAGRRSLTIRFPFTQITDDHLLAAMQVFDSDNILQAQEFAAMLDERTLPSTVGFFVELAGPLEPNAQLAPQRLFDALAAGNGELKPALEVEKMRLPTIQIVKEGTFAEYRQWKGERANIVSGQIKVPLVLFDPTAQEWFSERVVQEL